jgi:hypothetical protein
MVSGGLLAPLALDRATRQSGPVTFDQHPGGFRASPIEPSVTGCLGPESTELLRVVDLHLRDAQQSLADPAAETVVHGVARSLADTDDLFAALVRSWELDGCAAQRIETVRDELSSNLVAVAALQVAEVPVVGVLRRAVDAAISHVEAVLTSGRACGRVPPPETCLYA